MPAEAADDRGQRHARRDGEDDLLRRDHIPHVRQHAADHLRLDGEHDEVRPARRLAIALHERDAVARVEFVAPPGARVARADLIRPHDAARQHPGEHRLRHRPRPDERDPSYLFCHLCIP